MTPPEVTPQAPVAPPFSMWISGSGHTVGLQQYICLLSVCAAVLGASLAGISKGGRRKAGRHHQKQTQSLHGRVHNNWYGINL